MITDLTLLIIQLEPELAPEGIRLTINVSTEDDGLEDSPLTSISTTITPEELDDDGSNASLMLAAVDHLNGEPNTGLRDVGILEPSGATTSEVRELLFVTARTIQEYLAGDDDLADVEG